MTLESLWSFFSHGIWLWALIGALFIVVLALLVQLVRVAAARAAKRKLVAALEQTGIVVTDERAKQPRGVPAGGQQLLHQAQELADYEKRLREKEQLLHQQIERLYLQAQQLAKKQHQLAKGRWERPATVPPIPPVQVIPEPALAADDVQRVLLLTDELLEKLPDDAVQAFVSSPDFALYRKVLRRVKGGGAHGAA